MSDATLPAPPSYNPALHLSEEAQDLILSFVEYPTAKATALAFCRVSRTWLDSGRRALYRAPLLGKRPSWDDTQSILRTLESSPHLAACVRSLDSLPLWMSLSSGRTGGTPAMSRSRSSWQARMVELCWNATRISIAIGNYFDAKHLARLVAAHQRVEILELYSMGAHKLTRGIFLTFSQIVAKAFRRASPPRVLEHLVLTHPEWRSVEVPSTQKQWKRSSMIFARQYSIVNADIFSNDFRRIIPRQLDQLRQLTITTTRFHMSPSILTSLATHLPLTLESLSIDCQVYPSQEVTVDEYPPQYPPYNTTSRAPDILLTSFPHLVHLSLKGFRQLTSAQISLIAKSSPDLRELDFERSTWDFSILDVQEFTSAFSSPSTLPKLEHLNLGSLPLYEDDDCLEDFEADLAQRGVACEWEGCCEEILECEYCGGEGCMECDSEGMYGSGYESDFCSNCGSYCEGACDNSDY